MNTKDISVENFFVRALVYGKSGTGKTTFAATFPRPFFFDFDRGMLSLRGRDVEYVQYPKPGSSPMAAMDEFILDFDKIQDRKDVDTLVIDSISTLQEFAQQKLLAQYGKREMDLKLWAQLIDWFQMVLVRILKVEKHLIVIAHEQLIQDEISGEVQVLPLIVGKKLPNQMPLFFDEVYRAVVERSGKDFRYLLQTRADTRCIAKSRLGVLDPFETPDFKVIVEKIRAGR